MGVVLAWLDYRNPPFAGINGHTVAYNRSACRQRDLLSSRSRCWLVGLVPAVADLGTFRSGSQYGPRVANAHGIVVTVEFAKP